ncbi:glutathione S-transferase [Meinhardsimonia xiamenensis]|jgi:glutathione S-transferase|uniref:Glutathione S-transferase n=1 Tax=Meinhardsimonia xiamenensis TaxID=990712 RepID=A0A1G9FN99_9RHOB|nr:glutathione S-transferase family protein [Meinhardsimonia xiamenensis]PRX37760.1 glutathione S-transferase [Meinhardsimonia xiamenensis]SDK89846.1 glutathione S-transferase [Meinhardsimonia xiamenensis]
MIRLHHVPFSRSFRVLWFLEELGLEVEIVRYSIRDGSMRAPELLAISPAGRVPGIEIDDLSMFESGAILEYLAETHTEAGFDCPPGHPERHRYLELLHFAETMGALIENLNMQHLFLYNPKDASPVVIKILTARLRGTLKALEGMLREEGYLLEKGFTAADAMMGFNLFAAPYYVKLDPFPKLRAYRARLEARPAYQRAREKDGEQDFYEKDFYPVPEGA